MAAIAAAAGVSVSTVSRALSGAQGVSSAKRAEILAIARGTGYLAPAAGNAPDRRSRVRARISAVIPEPDRWVFGSILAGLHDVFAGSGATLTVHQGPSGAERARIAGSAGLYEGSDVVILVPRPRGTPLERLQEHRGHLVVAGSVVPGVPSVGIDDVAAGQKATNYLINTGYRRIAFAAYTDHEGTPGVASQARVEGFARSMERAGLDPSWVVRTPFGPTAGRAAAEEILGGDRLPEALVVSSDEMAASIMAVCERAGVDVPNDLAIVGMDDHPVADLVGLTTIGQPARDQGRVAARMALGLVAGRIPAEPVTLPTALVVRESTKRSRQG